ncbi:GLPGLI family protein [Elizabethkingia meningoseptica]|uniref:GLPGLI family protein n=1 Tax=Elizabethkingia meningoseptica TaxID=238 RepID=UPI00099AE9DC|nr:GLPGLI family protein [Elizabethkingia meningoseptica]MDE5467283.1 GLPGLI family protein [Elizabethkingia meningoseptica]MDE5473487.1 GLPGLI family protein [Elizabethkingia meningoseptica]MDE5476920.1 GLPGLI family protein [Elizabethkingia meningoseptica]MDE5484602.1 GLPGLI family protein [Elizabethkingia meningoseptica]MDE5500320.1 GLPGLI family protein [Elizabethkingia meningoseptica]
MKTTISLLCLLFTLSVQAQLQRFIYEYKFTNDSLKKDSLKSEYMFLDISKIGSKYYSKKRFDSDSIQTASIIKQMKMSPGSVSISRNMDGGTVDYTVEKVYPDFKTYLLTSVGMGFGNSDYKVLDERGINWKILPDKKKIGEFDAQKAETTFAGRKWIAWFTTEIPFQDGPYKFRGLPGLIVKIEDVKHTHIIELKASKKIPERELTKEETEAITYKEKMGKRLAINQGQYKKLIEQYRNDPVQGMREMMNHPGSKVKVNINGREISDKNEILKEMEKTSREQIKRDNNLIELSL